MATAYSSGNLKERNWNEFLDSLYKDKNINVEKTLDKLKGAGIDIEEN